MKKLTIVLTVMVLLCLLVSTGNAQWEKGKSYLGPRLGIGAYGSGLSFGAGYEYGVTNEIGIGGLVDYYTYDWGFGFKYTYLVIGAQGNYHFGEILKWDKKLDPFAGLVIGYENVSVSGSQYAGWSAAYSSGIIIGGQVGIRYFLSPSIALYGQAGFGITYLKVGIDFKF